MNRAAALCLFSAGLALAQASGAAIPELKGLHSTILDQRARISEDPGNTSLWNDLGNLLVLADLRDEALSAYRRAIEIDPENADAHFNLALSLQQAGHIEDAVSHYHSVLELDPRHGWALYQIGAVLEARKERAGAIEYYTQAFSLDRDLLFPEVNPHIVENELVLESLLRRVRNDPRDFSLPRIYAHRNRIVKTLVPLVPEEPTEAVLDIPAATEEKPADETATPDEAEDAEEQPRH